MNVVSAEYNDYICIDVARLLAKEAGFAFVSPPGYGKRKAKEEEEESSKNKKSKRRRRRKLSKKKKKKKTLNPLKQKQKKKKAHLNSHPPIISSYTKLYYLLLD